MQCTISSLIDTFTVTSKVRGNSAGRIWPVQSTQGIRVMLSDESSTAKCRGCLPVQEHMHVTCGAGPCMIAAVTTFYSQSVCSPSHCLSHAGTTFDPAAWQVRRTAYGVCAERSMTCACLDSHNVAMSRCCCQCARYASQRAHHSALCIGQVARTAWLAHIDSTVAALTTHADGNADARLVKNVVLVDDNAWLRSMRKAVAHIAQRSAPPLATCPLSHPQDPQ